MVEFWILVWSIASIHLGESETYSAYIAPEKAYVDLKAKELMKSYEGRIDLVVFSSTQPYRWKDGWPEKSKLMPVKR